MSIGAQASTASINQQLTNLAVQLRNIMQQITNLSTEINAGDAGEANLEGIGFDQGDADAVLSSLGYMSTVAGVYYGTVQQGGSGGTGAAPYNFNDALAPLWAGQ